jgi:hypothetical protein
MSISSNKRHDLKKKNIQTLKRQIQGYLKLVDSLPIFSDNNIEAGYDSEPEIDMNSKSLQTDVVLSFCRPWLELLEENKYRAILFDIAVMAWNLSLLKNTERMQKILDLIRSGKILDSWVEIIFQMIERKLKKFRDYKFQIVDYKAEFKENNVFHLKTSVMYLN